MVYDETVDRIYLNIKTKDIVAVIDPSLKKVVAEWPTAPAALPHGLALDGGQSSHLLGRGNGMVVIDTKTGAVASSVEIVPKVDSYCL